MKRKIQLKAKDSEDSLEIVIKMETSKDLNRYESSQKKAKLTNIIFNAVREYGYDCQDIKIK